jgi:hypothetical protein
MWRNGRTGSSDEKGSILGRLREPGIFSVLGKNSKPVLSLVDIDPFTWTYMPLSKMAGVNYQRIILDSHDLGPTSLPRDNTRKSVLLLSRY